MHWNWNRFTNCLLLQWSFLRVNQPTWWTVNRSCCWCTGVPVTDETATLVAPYLGVAEQPCRWRPVTAEPGGAWHRWNYVNVAPVLGGDVEEGHEQQAAAGRLSGISPGVELQAADSRWAVFLLNYSSFKCNTYSGEEHDLTTHPPSKPQDFPTSGGKVEGHTPINTAQFSYRYSGK